MVLREVDGLGDGLFHLLKQRFRFGKFAGLKKRSNSRRKVKDGKARALSGPGSLGRGSRIEHRAGQGQVRSFLGGPGNGGWRKQGCAVRPTGSKVSLLRNERRCQEQKQEQGENTRTEPAKRKRAW